MREVLVEKAEHTYKKNSGQTIRLPGMKEILFFILDWQPQGCCRQ